MPDMQELDQTYNFILQTFVRRGQAPHFTEIAEAFSATPEQGKHRLHELMAAGLPNWLYPGTDLITSFAPFNNLPTHYRITIDGQQKWFAQCALEALAVCWLFPGRAVEINAPCLESGTPLRVVVRDGVIAQQEPAGIHGYFGVPFREWRRDLPYA